MITLALTVFGKLDINAQTPGTDDFILFLQKTSRWPSTRR